MADVRVDRLTFEVPGLSASDGERLANLVASGLAAADLPEVPASAGVLRVDVRGGGDVDALASRIVEEIARRIARSL